MTGGDDKNAEASSYGARRIWRVTMATIRSTNFKSRCCRLRCFAVTVAFWSTVVLDAAEEGSATAASDGNAEAVRAAVARMSVGILSTICALLRSIKLGVRSSMAVWENRRAIAGCGRLTTMPRRKRSRKCAE